MYSERGRYVINTDTLTMAVHDCGMLMSPNKGETILPILYPDYADDF